MEFQREFPGSNYVSAVVPEPSLTQFTIAFWLKSENGSLEYPILTYQGSGTTPAIEMYLAASGVFSPIHNLTVMVDGVDAG